MSTNHYFNNFPGDMVTQEQLLVEDLLIEALKIYAHDCYYLPRESRDQIDYLMGEDVVKSFPNALPLEFYIENVMGMEGEGDLISKFGLEIRDEMTLLVSRRRFKQVVPELIRPREGDLIYVPLLQNFFEITFVEHENHQAMFYTLGRGRGANVYVYALKVKQFVFSEEQIATGISEVDDQIIPSYRPIQLNLSPGGTGNFDNVNNEIVFQGANLASATAFANASSWSVATQQLQVIRINGEFVPGVMVVGASSNAHWNVASVDSDSPLDSMFEDVGNNKQVQDEANEIFDFTETNPFGTP